MHTHVLLYEGFNITIFSKCEEIDWREVIEDLMAEVVTNG